MTSKAKQVVTPEPAICYSGFRADQNPGTGTYPSYAEVKEDLLILQDQWRYLRLYDVDPHADTVIEVIDSEKLDIKLMLGPDFAYPKGSELLVRDAMIRDAYVVDLDTPLDEVLAHMAAEQLGSAIVTRKDKLAGVFTVTDACLAFAEHLREQLRRSGGNTAA